MFAVKAKHAVCHLTRDDQEALESLAPNSHTSKDTACQTLHTPGKAYHTLAFVSQRKKKMWT